MFDLDRFQLSKHDKNALIGAVLAFCIGIIGTVAITLYNRPEVLSQEEAILQAKAEILDRLTEDMNCEEIQ